MHSTAADTAARSDLSAIPRHVAIIMDGNGRWAQKRGLPRLAGHRAGTENVRRIVSACPDFGVQILTLYAFSTENWSRPRQEVDGLMALLSESVDRELDKLHRNDVQVRQLGALEDLPASLRDKIRRATEMTAANKRLILNIALNYGGRREIVEAVRNMMREGLVPEQVTEETLAQHLYTGDLPDPDLIIRTAGEMRLSNFLVWQAAYAEFYSTATLWPDFGREELHLALEAYSWRSRKFGGLPDLATSA
jgi:undecaprenyl diphosphate synthase